MSTHSTESPNGFRKLKSTDLKAFNQKAKDMILHACDVGCVGRISNKGHAILHNNSGGTISISRNLSSNNHSLQKAEADLRRLLAAHTDTIEDETPPTASANQSVWTTVSQAFLDYGSEFSTWFDTVEQGMGPDDQVIVSTDSSGQYSFEAQPAAEPAENTAEEKTEQTVQAQTYQCHHCPKSFSTQLGLNGHQTAHRNLGPHLSTRLLAEVNDMEITAVRKRITKVQNDPAMASSTPEQKVIAAGLRLPADHQIQPAEETETTGESASTDSETTESAEDPRSDAEILERIRGLLGDDPQITQLQTRIDDLTAELSDVTAQRDEALTRLSMIQEAFTV